MDRLTGRSFAGASEVPLLSGKEAKKTAFQQFVNELGLPLIVSLAADPAFNEPALESALTVAKLKATYLKESRGLPLAAGADTAFYLHSHQRGQWLVRHQLQREFGGKTESEKQQLRNKLIEQQQSYLVGSPESTTDIAWVNAISVINGTAYGFPQTALLRIAKMSEKQFAEYADKAETTGLIDSSNAGGPLIESIVAHDLIRQAAVYDYLDFTRMQPEVQTLHQPNSALYELLSQAVLSSVPLNTARLKSAVARF